MAVFGGTTSGVVKYKKSRISPIPSGGYEIEILLNFKSRAALVDRMNVLLREYYDFDWTVTGQQDYVSTDGGSSSESDKYRIVFISDLTKRILYLL